MISHLIVVKPVCSLFTDFCKDNIERAISLIAHWRDCGWSHYAPCLTSEACLLFLFSSFARCNRLLKCCSQSRSASFPPQKHQDAFASAFGFFLLGFDVISRYSSPQGIHVQFFGITDPVLWFFKVATVTADLREDFIFFCEQCPVCVSPSTATPL